jgi:hypothetical protein
MQASQIKGIGSVDGLNVAKISSRSASSAPFESILANAKEAHARVSAADGKSSEAPVSPPSVSAPSSAIAGLVQLRFNNQTAPAYPPGHPKTLQDKMDQILSNPNISRDAKDKAWSYAVIIPSVDSMQVPSANSLEGRGIDNYKNPSFDANVCWDSLIQRVGNLGAQYADLKSALQSVANV